MLTCSCLTILNYAAQKLDKEVVGDAVLRKVLCTLLFGNETKRIDATPPIAGIPVCSVAKAAALVSLGNFYASSQLLTISKVLRALNEWSTGEYIDLSVLNAQSQLDYEAIEEKVVKAATKIKGQHGEAWISLSAEVYRIASYQEVPDTSSATSSLLSSLRL